MGRRTPLAVVIGAIVAGLVVLATVAALAVGAGSGDRSGTAPEGERLVPDVRVVEAVESLRVLRDWDAARAAAWAAGDPSALRALYVAGSDAGRHDVAMLRRWTARGLVVRRMAMQVLSVELRARSARRIVLLVTDRLAGAVAAPAGGGPGRVLPRDRATTRRLEFRRTAGGWRLVSAYARPLASTAVTSGSSNS